MNESAVVKDSKSEISGILRPKFVKERQVC